MQYLSHALVIKASYGSFHKFQWATVSIIIRSRSHKRATS